MLHEWEAFAVSRGLRFNSAKTLLVDVSLLFVLIVSYFVVHLFHFLTL